MKYLITGISGFVGGHLLEYLAEHRPDATIAGVDQRKPEFDFLDRRFAAKIQFHKNALLERPFIEKLLKKTQPDYIVHLASYSSVALSWKGPACFINNTNIFLNIVEAVRALGIRPRVLSVGSSDEYGIVREQDLPLREEAPLNPVQPVCRGAGVSGDDIDDLRQRVRPRYRLPLEQRK